MEANPIDLTTLDALKSRLSIGPTFTTTDDDLAALITQTSVDFLDATSRNAVFNADYTEKRNGHGGDIIVVQNIPINTVASVQVGPTLIAPQSTPGGLGYTFDDTAIMLVGYRFHKGYGNVLLGYNAGLGSGIDDADFPANIPLAVLDWCELRYRQRPSAGVSSKHMAIGESITYDKRVMPDTTRRVVQSYKRRTSVR